MRIFKKIYLVFLACFFVLINLSAKNLPQEYELSSQDITCQNAELAPNELIGKFRQVIDFLGGKLYFNKSIKQINVEFSNYKAVVTLQADLSFINDNNPEIHFLGNIVDHGDELEFFITAYSVIDQRYSCKNHAIWRLPTVKQK